MNLRNNISSRISVAMTKFSRRKLATLSRTFNGFKRHFGALTSKPYAFVARPWELESVNAIDNMGAFGTNILLQTRGNELMRVLPRTNDEINDDWIDDRTRFSYDGFKIQRLVKPLCRDVQNPNLWDRNTVNWRDILGRVATAYNELKEPGTDLVNFRAIIGPTADLYSVLALSDLSEMIHVNETDCSLESVGTRFAQNASDPSNYRFNSSIVGIEEADVCLFVGTNMDVDCPLFSVRLLKCFKTDEIRISQLGPNNGFNFPIEQLGLSPKILEDIANETHPYFRVLEAAESPMIVLDAGLFEREDSQAILKVIDVLAEKTNLRKVSESGEKMWDGVNIFHRSANDVGILDFGRISNFNQLGRESSILYLMNIQASDLPNGAADIEKLASTSRFIIYQGSHGDELASIADVVLPGAAFSEKAGIYTNLEGRAQLSHRALTPPGVGKNDWAIIRALSEVIGHPLPFDSEEDLQARLEMLVPNTEYSNLGEAPGVNFFAAGKKHDFIGSISAEPFVRKTFDFYLEGHPAARASKVMASFSKDSLECHKNFIDY